MTNQITEVRLLAVPLENDYKHTVYFGDAHTQYLAMSSKAKHSFTEFTYQRKDRYIAVPMHFDDIQDCNYVMYKNKTSWIYAFITKMEYKNDNVTWVYIETDVIQTYMFKADGSRGYTIQPSFIEREHVTDDTIGLHTVPENLETGEYICTFNANISDLQNTRIIVGVTEYPDGSNFKGGRYNNTYSGVKYYAFETIAELNAFIGHYRDGDSTDEAIVCMFMAPQLLSTRNPGDIVSIEMNNEGFSVIQSNTTLLPAYGTGVNKSVLQDKLHTIRNNKLYCYPYKYLTVSNNNGASAIYQYEHFSVDNCPFELHGVLTPGCSIRLIPQNYKGVLSNEEEGLNLGKYPILNWTSDVYTNWLTQNGVNIAINMATGLGQMLVGGALAAGTGGAGIAVGGGQIASGATQIANQLGQIHQMSFTPPQAQGNINCGDVVAAKAQNTFTFYAMSIKAEYLAIIDDYFDMFGYKCNLVKVPNSNHRETWWYTKTIDVNIDGDIYNVDLQKIKEAYNNGITFWRNFASIGNYSLSNSIK